MCATAIPDWTSTGVLPPVDALAPTSAERSPYSVSLLDLVLRFNTSDRRRDILNGLLDFRSELHQLGLVGGFQWVDGSFLEDIERTEDRQPGDIDVVTFFDMPDGKTQTSLLLEDGSLFDPSQTKARFQVDAFFVELSPGDPRQFIEAVTYWHSLWSHRRTGEWKGYLKIDLTPDQDAEARANLLDQTAEGGQQ